MEIVSEWEYTVVVTESIATVFMLGWNDLRTVFLDYLCLYVAIRQKANGLILRVWWYI